MTLLPAFAAAAILAGCVASDDEVTTRAASARPSGPPKERALPYRAPTPAGGRLSVIENGKRPCLIGSLETARGALIRGTVCQSPATSRQTLAAAWVMNCSLKRFVVFGWVRSPVRFLQARMTDGTTRAAAPMRTRRGRPRTGFVLELHYSDRVQAIEGLDRGRRVIRTIAGSAADQPSCAQLPAANGYMADFPGA
jgi:hypothetical protein